ncbi:Smr/MutS family protein [Sphingobacterium psychroaquaticum]|uniref:Smr domain-containing protein n=1 Tax=Sphingobacterium psychroaquaticum TaxID=561061 RepID=A0A1X7KR52_9SPHI|nr:Smr/MutS family protein [Sphingobacterium psychroaquaticum]SMG43220.1 Smr domain-containing protein [Sphingobacterium psychroaquaticum]
MARELPRPAKEVDLHAEDFIHDMDVYEARELLSESIDLLRASLDAAIYWDYPEIRFIHGKGKGILKKAVYEELAYYKQSGAIASYHPSYHNEDIVVVHIGL